MIFFIQPIRFRVLCPCYRRNLNLNKQSKWTFIGTAKTMKGHRCKDVRHAKRRRFKQTLFSKSSTIFVFQTLEALYRPNQSWIIRVQLHILIELKTKRMNLLYTYIRIFIRITKPNMSSLFNYRPVHVYWFNFHDRLTSTPVF